MAVRKKLKVETETNGLTIEDVRLKCEAAMELLREALMDADAAGYQVWFGSRSDSIRIDRLDGAELRWCENVQNVGILLRATAVESMRSGD